MTFSIQKILENGFEEVLVKNDLTGTSFSIIPSHGAALNSFYFKNQEWIDGYKSLNQLQEKPYKSALLAPFPNRIKDGKYTWQNKEYKLPINRPQEQHAIHGFLYNCHFEKDQEKIAKNKIEVSFKHEYQGDYEGFPFPFTIKIKYTLSNKEILKIKTSVENTGNEIMPFGLGFHPYFKTTTSFDESILTMPACEMLPLDKRMLPTEAVVPFTIASKDFPGKDLTLDDCFKITDKANFTLKDTKSKNAIAVTSKNLNYFQLYTPSNRKSIAIEPMSCPPNVFNNEINLLKIKPSQKYKATWKIEGVK